MIFVYLHTNEQAAQNNSGSNVAPRDEFFRESLENYLAAQSKTLGASAKLDFEYGEHGKPRFADKQLADILFSVSHSGRFFAVAFSDSEVGIDVEDLNHRHSDAERYCKIAWRFLCADEANYVSDGFPGEDVKRRFFLVWTAKEAYVKYTGEGIAENFERFSALNAVERKGEKTSRADFAEGVYLTRVIETRDVICTVCGEGRNISTCASFPDVI